MTKEKKSLKVIEKIKKDDIKPVPKWQGYFRNGLFWLAVVLAVFFSALAFSAFILTLFEIPLEIFREFHLGGYMRIIFQALPYFWLISILIIIFLGLWAFQKTRYGYRYQIFGVVGVGIVLMILFGFIFGQYKVSQSFKNLAERPIPEGLRGGVLNRGCFVEDGLLGGEIVKIEKEFIYIKNPRNEEWRVIVEDDTVIKSWDDLKVSDRVLVIGEKKGKFIFKASVVKEINEKFKNSSNQKKINGPGFSS
jgi:hypothetical protein